MHNQSNTHPRTPNLALPSNHDLMTVHPPILIASANMHKRNAVTHALLNSNNKTHLMLIQEPWYNAIRMTRKDNVKHGADILGGIVSPAWEIHYPGLTKGQKPKVMAYL